MKKRERVNFSISFPFHRRDFRQAKLDQATGNGVANPVVWTNRAVQSEVSF